MTKIRTYSEVKKLKTFEERFEYLKLNGNVGSDTFGFDRHINQKFYKSNEWKRVRDQVIVRDEACDLGIQDRDIPSKILIHHMNPIDIRDIEDASEYLLNPEYLICMSHDTHNAIHYGDATYLKKNQAVDRKPNDQTPWKGKKT